MRPLIGVTSELDTKKISLHENYLKALLMSDALPIVLPYSEDLTQIKEMTARIDGLVLTGGTDVDPTIFGEEPKPGLQKVDPKRDQFEKWLTLEALQNNLPILAICRGNQMLNAVAGGTLYQDLFGLSNVLQHHQDAPRDHCSHFIQIYNETHLSKITTHLVLKVNSFHHQAVKDPAPGFRIAAVSSDGIIEAIESEKHRFVIGVQWHPGDLVEKDSNARQLFSSFVQACSSQRVYSHGS